MKIALPKFGGSMVFVKVYETKECCMNWWDIFVIKQGGSLPVPAKATSDMMILDIEGSWILVEPMKSCINL